MIPASARPGMTFQGKDRGEEFQFYYHQHWIRMMWPFTRLIISNILIGVAGYFLMVTFTYEDPMSKRTILIILTAFFLLSHVEFIGRFYQYLLHVIVVTDKKVHRIKKTLITLDDHESTDLWVLQDINKRQHGLVQNIFGYGTIILEAQETEVRIHFTPNIREKYALFTRLREQARTHMTRWKDAESQHEAKM